MGTLMAQRQGNENIISSFFDLYALQKNSQQSHSHRYHSYNTSNSSVFSVAKYQTNPCDMALLLSLLGRLLNYVWQRQHHSSNICQQVNTHLSSQNTARKYL